ncbi:MAG: hypothetical protein HQL54_13870 [Magnetococcales bacterium]|nr:hypothetical protein [Magnetococcales bacterium]
MDSEITKNTTGKSVSFWKGLVLTYLIFLAIFFAATPFLTFLLYWETDLSTTMLPELIGFCLQGAFLVLIFGLYERRSAINAKNNQKFALRMFVSSFLHRSLSQSDNSGSGESYPSSLPNPFEKEINLIQQEGLTDRQAKRLRTLARLETPSLASLSAVAAGLDYAHLEAWNTILNDLRRLRDSTTLEDTSRLTLALLGSVNRFDALAFS